MRGFTRPSRSTRSSSRSLFVSMTGSLENEFPEQFIRQMKDRSCRPLSLYWTWMWCFAAPGSLFQIGRTCTSTTARMWPAICWNVLNVLGPRRSERRSVPDVKNLASKYDEIWWTNVDIHDKTTSNKNSLYASLLWFHGGHRLHFFLFRKIMGLIWRGRFVTGSGMCHIWRCHNIVVCFARVEHSFRMFY